MTKFFFSLSLALLLSLNLTFSAQAQEYPAASPEKAEVTSTLKMLENEKELGDFKAKLRQLIEAEKKVSVDSAATKKASHHMTSFYALVDEIKAIAEHPQQLLPSLNVLMRILAIAIVYMAAYGAFRRLTLRKLAQKFAQDKDNSFSHRLGIFITALLKGSFSFICFAVGATLITLTHTHTAPHEVMPSFYWVALIAGGIHWIAAICLNPGLQDKRFIVTSNDAAAKLMHVINAYLTIGIGIYIISGILVVSHLSELSQRFIDELMALVVVGYTVYVTFKHRKDVGNWLHGNDAKSSMAGSSPWLRHLSEAWHILIILSVLTTYVLFISMGTHSGAYVLRGVLFSALIVVVARSMQIIARKVSYSILQRAQSVASTEQRKAIFKSIEGSIVHFLTFIRFIIVAAAVLSMMELWNLELLDFLHAKLIAFVITGLVQSSFILLILFVLWEGLDIGIQYYTTPQGKSYKPSARTKTFMPIIRNIGRIFIIVMGSLMILMNFNVNVTPIIASLGVFSVAISFGSQSLVKDFVTGLFVLLENDIEIGDYIKATGLEGVVERLNFRTIHLRDSSGALHTLPFGEIHTLTNLSRDYTATSLEVHVGHKENIATIYKFIEEVGQELQKDETFGKQILGPVTIFGVKEISDAGSIVFAKVRSLPDPHNLLRLEFNRRMRAKLVKAGIDLPVQHRQILIDQGEPLTSSSGQRGRGATSKPSKSPKR